MAKVSYTSLKQPKGKTPDSVRTKRVRGTHGKFITVYTVDADSRTFEDDLGTFSGST